MVLKHRVDRGEEMIGLGENSSSGRSKEVKYGETKRKAQRR
jgi:hypothetical protein